MIRSRVLGSLKEMRLKTQKSDWLGRFSLSVPLAIAIAVAGTSCSSEKISGRSVASLSGGSDSSVMEDEPAENEFTEELSDERLRDYFNTLLSSEDPASQVRHSVDQLVSIYFRTESALRQFDQELDQAVADGKDKPELLLQLRSYPRMLAYWEITHRARERIHYVYDRLLSVRTSRADKKPEYRKAHEALKTLAEYFQSADGADRLALQSVGEDLKTVFESYSPKITHDLRHEIRDSFDNVTFESGDEVRSLLKQRLIRDQIDTRIRAVDSTDLKIDRSADRISRRIHKQMIEQGDLSGREPQSDQLRFYPSAGPHGTISGDEYPKGVWSITYDDGPSGKYSPMVLKNLGDHGFKATLFELATNVRELPKVSMDYLNAGMEMANHSYTHPQLPKLDEAHLEHEIGDSTKVETAVWGEDHRPKLFRCPYGAGLTVPRVRQAIAKHGMIHVFWNVDTLDWQDKNPDSILARAKKEMKALHGGIILFHDIHPQSVEASRMLMDYFKEQGLKQRKVGDVIEELNHASN